MIYKYLRKESSISSIVMSNTSLIMLINIIMYHSRLRLNVLIFKYKSKCRQRTFIKNSKNSVQSTLEHNRHLPYSCFSVIFFFYFRVLSAKAFIAYNNLILCGSRKKSFKQRGIINVRQYRQSTLRISVHFFMNSILFS